MHDSIFQQDVLNSCTSSRRFVFCRQRSDERLKRGGEQKSVVVLSTQPYSSVLMPLSQYAGPLYFNRGKAALHEVTLSSSRPHLTINPLLLIHPGPARVRDTTPAIHIPGISAKQRLTEPFSDKQVYQEVQMWEPPSPGLRAMVMVGAVTLPAQVPAPATLPAAPPASREGPEHPFAPLPVVRQAYGCDTIQGAFFEVGSPSHSSREIVQKHSLSDDFESCLNL